MLSELLNILVVWILILEASISLYAICNTALPFFALVPKITHSNETNNFLQSINIKAKQLTWTVLLRRFDFIKYKYYFIGLKRIKYRNKTYEYCSSLAKYSG